MLVTGKILKARLGVFETLLMNGRIHHVHPTPRLHTKDALSGSGCGGALRAQIQLRRLHRRLVCQSLREIGV